MERWLRSAAWRTFRIGFAAAGHAASIAELARLERELERNEPALSRARAERPDLARDLDAALRARIESRRRALRQPRGKRPRPDWRRELSGALERLGHEAGALGALRALGVADPWIEAELAPAVALGCEVVEGRAELVERECPAAPEAASLVTRARREAANARRLLGA